MGCQCNNQKEEQNTEISKNDDNLDDYNNNEQRMKYLDYQIKMDLIQKI